MINQSLTIKCIFSNHGNCIHIDYTLDYSYVQIVHDEAPGSTLS